MSAGQLRAGVVFDVDGPLLELTRGEEDAFFEALRALHGIVGLSRDWDSYRVRNDREIVGEILHNHFGRPPREDDITTVLARYLEVLEAGYGSGELAVEPIPGAARLLARLARIEGVALGMATANIRAAARLRLERAGMWRPLAGFAGAADEGGAKRDVLARVVADMGLAGEHIVYVGDNLNDLDAGIANRVHFIGFSTRPQARRRLAAAGAAIVSGDHDATFRHILAAIGEAAG